MQIQVFAPIQTQQQFTLLLSKESWLAVGVPVDKCIVTVISPTTVSIKHDMQSSITMEEKKGREKGLPASAILKA